MSEIKTGPFLNAPSYEAAVAALTGGRTDFSSMGTIGAAEGSWPSWRVTERDLGGYFKLNFEGSFGGVKYNANAGVRLGGHRDRELRDPRRWLFGQTLSSTATRKPLPSATINFTFDDKRVLRIGLARAISRPPLDELRAGQYISAVSSLAKAIRGIRTWSPSPRIRSTWPMSGTSRRSPCWLLALYYKNIKNYVGYTSFDVQTANRQQGGRMGADEWRGRPHPGSRADLPDAVHELPGHLLQLRLRRHQHQGVRTRRQSLPMAGLAKHTATVDLWLSFQKFEARLGYKYHSGYTTGFEWTGSSLRRLDPEQNLGLNLAYHLTKKLSLRLQGNNLTNEPLRLTQNNDDLDVRRYDAYGRTYLLDLTFKLR